jgi:putative membrane protein
MSTQRRKPLSMPLTEVEKTVVIKEEDQGLNSLSTPVPFDLPSSRTNSAIMWFLFSLMGLGVIVLGFDLWLFTKELLAIHMALGAVVLSLAITAALSLIYMIVREVLAFRGLSNLSDTRRNAEVALATSDDVLAKKTFRRFRNHYEGRPEFKLTLVELKTHEQEVYTGVEMLAIAERALLRDLDQQAIGLINAQARTTALLSTISPYAILDVLVTVWRNLKLIRQLAELYGTRPGYFSSIKLMKQVLGHIAVTGGMEAGDSLVSELFGGSFLTKLSTKLGEALINGLLTARVGVTAMSQVRPLPFNALPKPTVKQVAKDIVKEFKDRLV